MPDLQKWQVRLLQVNDLDKFQVFAKKVQRLTDAGVSKKAQPGSYEEIVKAAQAIADSLIAMGADSPERHLQEHAGSPELQEYAAGFRKLVAALLPYWQGQSIAGCDKGAAEAVQAFVDALKAEVPEPPPVDPGEGPVEPPEPTEPAPEA